MWHDVAKLLWTTITTIMDKIKDEHKLTAELALKDINKPIGVAEYKYL